MAKGGQLGFAPAAPATPWWKYLLYAAGAALVLYILYSAFKPCPPPTKETFLGGCPCNKNKSAGPIWRPLM